MPNLPLPQGSQATSIPALPSRPGAATGTQSAPVAGGATPGAVIAGDRASEAQQAATATRDAVRDAVQTTIRNTVQLGESGTLVPPPGGNSGIPKEVIPLVGMSLGMVVAMVVCYPIARAIGRVIERRGEAGIVKASDVAPQLQQLQASVDTLAVELERMSEAQRFTAKLMAERSPELPSGATLRE